MSRRCRSAFLLVAVIAPFVFGAVSIAAGHVVPNWLPFYVNHLDTAVITFNAVVASATTGAAAFFAIPKRAFGTVVASLAFAAALPAYTLSYLFLWHWFSDLGIGMTW